MKKKSDVKRLFGSMYTEWKWLGKYTKRYKMTICVYILLGITATALSLGSSVTSKYLIDAVVQHLDEKLLLLAVSVVGLQLLQYAFSALSSYIVSLSGSRANNEIREDIFSHVINAKTVDTSCYHSGDIVNRLEGDALTVSNAVIGFIPSIITRFVQFFGSLAIVLYYDPTMALFALMSAPFLFLSSHVLIKTIRKYSRESRELNGSVISFSAQAVQNVQIIKAFDITKQYIESFKKILEKYRECKLSYDRFSILMTFLMSVMGILVSYSCYGWGVYRLWQGAISFGTMTLFLQISGSLTGSFGSLASLVPSAVSISTAAGRIKELTDLAEEDDAGREKAEKMLKSAEKTGVHVIFDNVSFAYAGEKTILKNVSLKFSPGQTIAITGPSGEGKTTFFKLLLGLITPTSGSIYLEDKHGERITVSDSTRRFCSYVPQDVNMLSGSIAYNLSLGKQNACDSELISALQAADIYNYIKELKDGMNTVIGEGGVALSQGQLQRIAIARALLRNSLLLLMDEATSALDGETEKNVLESIMKSEENRICIITTHRESMLKYCNSVYTVTPDGEMHIQK